MKNRFAGVAGLALALLVFPAAMNAAEPPAAERKLLQAFYELETGTLAAPDAREACLLTLPAVEVAEDLRETASGFFGVSGSHSLVRLCDAMITATQAGILQNPTLRVLVVDGDEEDVQGYEIGRFFRAIYLAQQR
jgi:hypothetical protein